MNRSSRSACKSAIIISPINLASAKWPRRSGTVTGIVLIFARFERLMQRPRICRARLRILLLLVFEFIEGFVLVFEFIEGFVLVEVVLVLRILGCNSKRIKAAFKYGKQSISLGEECRIKKSFNSSSEAS